MSFDGNDDYSSNVGFDVDLLRNRLMQRGKSPVTYSGLSEVAFLSIPPESLFAKYRLLHTPCAFVGFQGCYSLKNNGQVNIIKSSVGFYDISYRPIVKFKLSNLGDVDVFIDDLFGHDTRVELDASRAALSDSKA
jgi:hypothetical protein